MADLADDDCNEGVGMVVEYAGHQGKPLWIPPKPFRWSYARFANPSRVVPESDEVIEMTFITWLVLKGGAVGLVTRAFRGL